MSAIEEAFAQVLEQVADLAMAHICQPGEDVSAVAPEDVVIKKNQFFGQDFENVGFGFEPFFADRLEIFYHQQFPESAVEVGVEGTQELGFDEIDAAFLVEAMGNLDAATFPIEFAFVTNGEDDMIVSGLDLHPITGGLAAVIALAGRP